MIKDKIINVNGTYGCGVKKSEFVNLAELISHMDKFGISASVTYHAEARDLNPLYGNRQLMADISENLSFSNRIIPCFVIAPAMLFREGEIEHVIDNLASKKVSAVAVFPKTSRCKLREIKKVLMLIKKYKPLVLIDTWEIADEDFSDMQQIAKEFKQLKFIIRHAMWWHFTKIVDLMHYCDNILADISYFHFRDAMKTIASRYGADKIVFGLGPKVHGGAAIASLVYCDVSCSIKKQILSGNLIKILNIDERRLLSKTPEPINDLWQHFISGNGIKDIDVIDSHSHIGPPARGWCIPQVEIESQIEKLQNEMHKFGIKKIISAPENALFAHALKGNALVENFVAKNDKCSGRFLGYFVYNPHYAAELPYKVLDEYFKREYFIGFKILPEYWGVSVLDDCFVPMWQYAQKYRLPILIHTWEGQCGTAEMVAKIAPNYPDAFFILGHSGGGDTGRSQAERAAMLYENVYLEWCGSFTSNIEWESTIKKVGVQKVIFGTDTFFHDIAWETGRLLSLNLTLQQFRSILGGNIKNILLKRKQIDK